MQNRAERRGNALIKQLAYPKVLRIYITI